jgi:hypothetical protein
MLGFDDLVDKPPIHASHPKKLAEETCSRIIELSLENPSSGQQRNADQPALEAVIVCDTTVRKLWLKEGLEKS